jgi:hypothetical protein
MSITNYNELKTAIASWMHRTDINDPFYAQIPDYISLAEARINRTFLPRSQEQEDELTCTAGSRYVTLPSGVINPIGLWLKAWLPRQKLTCCLPSELPVKTNATGYPEYWAIDNGNIAFDKLCESAFTFDFRYTKTFALSSTNTTNYILTNNPDLYLWGALVEASDFVRDSEGVAKYEARFQKALMDAQNNENDTRAIVPLTTEIGAANRNGRFNIIRGY